MHSLTHIYPDLKKLDIGTEVTPVSDMQRISRTECSPGGAMEKDGDLSCPGAEQPLLTLWGLISFL